MITPVYRRVVNFYAFGHKKVAHLPFYPLYMDLFFVVFKIASPGSPISNSVFGVKNLFINFTITP